MKLNKMLLITISTLLVCGTANLSAAQQDVNSRIGKLSFTKDFENGYPTHATVKKLFDEMDFQRATQAYLWSIPLISFVWW